MWLVDLWHSLSLKIQLQETFMHSVKIGIIPLGKENNFFKQYFPGQCTKLPARSAGISKYKNTF